MRNKLIIIGCLFFMAVINLIYAIFLILLSPIFTGFVLFSYKSKSLKSINFYQHLIPKLPTFPQKQ